MSRTTTLRPSVPYTAPDAKSKSPPPRGYWQRSETPLTNLAFALPLLIAYELGSRHSAQNSIVAFTILQRFFALFNATGRYLPSATLVVVLLASHVARRDPWRVVWTDLAKMLLESAALALPLIVLWFAAAPYLARLPLFASPATAIGAAVPCIGAGIYEELVFRLIAFNLLGFLLIDLMRTPAAWAYAIIVFLSAVSFSAYHYLGYEHFTPVTFVFRTIAGFYFAAIFLCRGFGVSCGSHAAYDVIVVCLPLFH